MIKPPSVLVAEASLPEHRLPSQVTVLVCPADCTPLKAHYIWMSRSVYMSVPSIHLSSALR